MWDRRIVFATACAWEWDLADSGLSKAAYAELLAGLAGRAGFQAVETDEPEVRWDEANMLLVRVGPHVDDKTLSSFRARLLECCS